MLLFDNNNDITVNLGLESCLDGTSNVLLVGEVGKSMNVNPRLTDRGAFPIWAGGNPNDTGPDMDCITGGIASTLRVADIDFPINRPFVAQTNPSTVDKSDFCFGSYHPGGAQFVYTDASVHFVPQTVNTLVWRRMGSRNDGFPVQLP